MPTPSCLLTSVKVGLPASRAKSFRSCHEVVDARFSTLTWYTIHRLSRHARFTRTHVLRGQCLCRRVQHQAPMKILLQHAGPHCPASPSSPSFVPASPGVGRRHTYAFSYTPRQGRRAQAPGIKRGTLYAHTHPRVLHTTTTLHTKKTCPSSRHQKRHAARHQIPGPDAPGPTRR